MAYNLMVKLSDIHMEKEQEKKEKVSERSDRIAKLEALRSMGVETYPAKSEKNTSNAYVIENFERLEETNETLVVAGRVRAIRGHGNLTFAVIEDESRRIQTILSKKDLGEKEYKTFVKYIDNGDFVELSGKPFLSQRGEKSIFVSSWRLLSKALRPLPDQWYGFKDEEDRLRKRYVDLIMNPELRDMFKKKSLFWQTARDFMRNHNFFEVETPTIEVTTGGAEANPFRTHHKDFDLEVFMRISVGELWQKRLMAAGYEKTFEIGRVYRNEGSSPDHLQEFTNLEFYWAYADYEKGMKLVQEMYQEIAMKVFGKTKFTTKGMEYDLAGEWGRIDYRDEVKKQTGIDVLEDGEDKMKTKLEELRVKYEGDNRERLTDTLWKYCRKNIAGPVFLINHPKLVSPLSKAKVDNPELTERFQVIIAGSEVGNGFSELNDPIDQMERFKLQEELIKRGDDEAMMPDWEFVEMLEYGMPPTCGFGFGERLFAFMVDKPVRETTLFPLMKPKELERE
jgi:lysyl-tRNA synthetase class 2